MTSLANQLAALKNQNGSIIIDKKKRKAQHSVSLIYEPNVAATQSYDTLLEIGLEGLRDLQLLDTRFSIFENSLFSETSKSVDRNVQTVEQNQLLDNAINGFLLLIAPRINIQPSIKALEWLVRRFMIHQFNSEQLLLTVLPYYSSPVFLRVLDIIPSNLPPIFSFLTNSKRHVQNPSRNLLIRAFSTDSQFLDLVNNYVIHAISQHRDYHDLLAFWSSFSIWTMISMKEQRMVEEDVVNKFLEPISQAITAKNSSDAQIAGYMVLTVLGSQFSLSKDVRQAAISSIVANWSKTSQKSGFSCITQLVESAEYEDIDELLTENVFTALKKGKNLIGELVKLSTQHSVGKFTVLWVKNLFQEQDIITATKLVEGIKLKKVFSVFIESCIELGLNNQTSQSVKAKIGDLLQKYSAEETFDTILHEKLIKYDSNIDNLELALQTSLKLANGMEIDEKEPEEITTSQNGTDLENQLNELQDSTVVSYLFREETVNEDFKLRISLFSHLLSRHHKSPLNALKILPDSQMSFLARLCISKCPTFLQIKALKLFTEQIRSGTDYQAFIPCLICALTSHSERVRREAGNALVKLSELPKASAVWGMDVVYGPKSTEVKWLGDKDQKRLLSGMIVPNLEECYLDSDYIVALFGTLKQSKELRSIVGTMTSFLSSHALAVEFPALENALLTCLIAVDKKSSAKFLGPLFTSWLKDYNGWNEKCQEDAVSMGELSQNLIRCVNNSDKTGLVFLQNCLSDSSLASFAGEQIISIWKDLKPEAQLYFLQFLTDGIVVDNLELDTMNILQNIDISANQFVELLEGCKLEKDKSATPGNTVAKRRRRSSASSRQQLQSGELASFAEKHLKKLTSILELLDSQTKQAQPENSRVLSQLFIILGEVVSLGSDAKLPVLYTEQILADCMISVVNKLKEQNWRSSKIDSNLVRVGTIVSCIRSCPSPQVQNRMLLLVANLAELAPEVVLHSVMPIFTFMGANTLRFDDEFSAHVIQRTIEQIVPALLAQGKNNEEVDFLLLSFAAAFIHIPRHRRFKLFDSLVRTLGISESLFKLLLLLAQKYCESTMKRKGKEANTFVQFTVAFLRSFQVKEQIIAIEKYLLEVSMLFSEKNQHSQLQVALLNSTTGEELHDQSHFYEFLNSIIGDQSIPGTIPLRLTFLEFVKQDSTAANDVIGHCTKILDLLLEKSNLNGEQMDTDESETISETSFRLLCTVLRILPIDNFANVVSDVLSSSSETLLIKELADLISKKFSYEIIDDENAIKAAWRIMDTICHEVSRHGELSADLFDCLDVLVSKYGIKETDNAKLIAMLDVVTGEMGLNNENSAAFVSAVACCNSICNVLGALSISKFPLIIPVVIDRFKLSLDNDEDDGLAIQLSVFGLFGGLLRRVPTFLTSTVPKILELVFLSNSSLPHRQKLVNVIIEMIPKDEIVKSFSKTWKYARENGIQSILLFLDSLDEILEIMTKKEANQSSTTFITVILDVFDVRRLNFLGTGEINHVESKAVSSTLKIVMKLNDKTFRPLFIDMVQWAGTDQDHLIVFFKFFVKLLSSLKSIVTNYFGYVLDMVTEILQNMALKSENIADSLKRSVLNSCIASFQYDRDEFWQSQARFDEISSSLANLIPSIDNNLGKQLVKALVTLAESVGSTEMYRELNDKVCCHLNSSCTVHEKIWAIRTIKGFYSKLGEEWVTMLPQLVPLTAELLEDDDESVEMEVRRNLVPVMEEVLGESLDRYLS